MKYIVRPIFGMLWSLLIPLLIIFGILVIIIVTIWRFKFISYQEISEMKMFSEWDVRIHKSNKWKFIESDTSHDIAKINNTIMIIYPTPLHWGFSWKGQEMDYSTWETKEITKHHHMKKPPF